MMEAVQTSETLVNSYHCIQCYNPEDDHLHNHCSDILKSCLKHFYRAAESSNAIQKTTSNFSVFNFLDASSYNTILKPPANSVFNEAPSVSEFSEVTLKQKPEAQECEVESDTLNEVSSEQKSEDSLLEFPDPPAKIDLYKAIFLSSSEDSDSDSNENYSVNLAKENNLKEMTSSDTNRTESLLLESVPQAGRGSGEEDTVSSSNTLTAGDKNAQRNMSPPRGVFANLDLDAINARKKEKLSAVPENKTQSDIGTSRQTTNEDLVECEQNSSLEIIEENMYGPRLPSISSSVSKNTTLVHAVSKVLPSIAVAPVHTEWVEKTKEHSHKNKHKKHKKSSKHKKHKYKKKRH
jgi:G patch domain-containing protein 1